MLNFLGWALLLSPVLALQSLPWTVSVFLAPVLVGVFFWLSYRHASKQDASLGQSFAHFYGLNLSEQDILRVLVLEEIQNCLSRGQHMVVEKARKRRLIHSAIYLITAGIFLWADFVSPMTPAALAYASMLYIHVFGRWSSVNTMCRMATEQPNANIHQLVTDNSADAAPKSRKPWFIAAVAAILAIFVIAHQTESFSFEAVEGGYCLTSYSPSLSMDDHVSIPDTYKGKPVVAIGKGVFQDDYYLKQIDIPQSVVSIDAYAFDGCTSLKRITLPEGLKTLKGCSFRNCAKLESIQIPQGVSEIRGNTFEGCTALTQVTLHDGIVDIHAHAFKDCESLESITLPRSITEIHTHCFAGCKALTSIVIPEGVTRIAARAFWKCSQLQDVSLPSSLLEIRSSAFRDCKALKRITIPSHTSVNARAFKNSPTIITYQ